ncbi:DUF4013 domain-containing protein [Methanococcus maripaludis]|uniref:Lysylphosphatidylglycerol synthetase-like protein (DUF2156 family) n=1 Tax=Methanococcus maripaludis TaxID=39152 RepID=A0A2L1C8E7_METMI|nr:DUF4013 domain-containing protein [Methanococcus maripaludis]AVB75573.1 hypothetical protein MMJJ_01540 [Methanococcus maripaludis]MBA2863898.1 lysylphosphatidylglycerol synthetase-like protein (DUF2156 family) [Methanococcus maripaludis]MBB6496096.1 lysylphosphatidylglycerol synthetase-like protein (DUF2156 family) [Methanococcus maripaludis]
MFFENYVFGPLKYSLSDLSKLLKGGIIYAVSIFLLILGIFLAVYPYASANLHIFGTATNSLVFAVVALFASLLGLGLLIVLNGYILKMIKLSLEKSLELPEWANYWDLLKNGVVFTLGIAVIAVFGTILQNIMTYFGNDGIASIVLSMIIQLIISLYIPLSVVNFAHEDNFGAFFDIPKIFKMMSFEYLGMFIVVSIISILLMIIPMILVIFPLIGFFGMNMYTGPKMLFIASPLLLVVALFAFIVFSIVAVYVSFYSYRAYTNYFVSKNLKKIEEFNHEL